MLPPIEPQSATTIKDGSAVAVILFAISFVLSLGYQRFVLRRDTQGGVTRMAG